MFVTFGIRHVGWLMYQGYLTVFFAFIKTAFRWLSLVTSGMWSLSFVFVEPVVAEHYWHWHFLAFMESLRWLSIICADMVIPFFGCTVRFNPWCVDFISGLSSCENQPCFGWLIVKLFSLLQVKIGLIKTFCLWPAVFCWAVMIYGQAFSFCNTVWVVFLEEYPWRAQVA